MDDPVRYGNACHECIRLAAESEALYQEYLAARDALTMTPKSDRAYLERRQRFDKVTGRLR